MKLTVPVEVVCQVEIDDALTYDERDIRAALHQAIDGALRRAEAEGFEHFLSSVLRITIKEVDTGNGPSVEERANEMLQETAKRLSKLGRDLVRGH